MPRRSSTGLIDAVSRPSSRTRPDVGSIIRLTIRSAVVLPHPDGPTSTVVAPDGASRLSPPTARVPSGYRLVTDSNRMMVSLLRDRRRTTKRLLGRAARQLLTAAGA